MLRLLRRLIARWRRPMTEDDVGGSDMAEAKRYAQSRDLSPPPPGSGIP